MLLLNPISVSLSRCKIYTFTNTLTSALVEVHDDDLKEFVFFFFFAVGQNKKVQKGRKEHKHIWV